jgi:hypothetical protein
MKRKNSMITAIVTAFYVAGIALAVHAAMTVRTAQGAVAWLAGSSTERSPTASSSSMS